MANLDHVSYADVERMVGKAKAPEAWKQLCRAGGFGNIPENFDGGISFMGAPESMIQEAEGILAGDGIDTVDTLSKLTRSELQAKASELGLDGDAYTNKSELAAAIVAKQNEGA
jgi:hypothetical protein